MKRQNGHFWRPLARQVEASVNPVMVAPMECAAEGQDVDEKMDEVLSVEERSARVVRKPGEPTPEQRSAHESTHLPFRDWCPHFVSCRASDPGHRLTHRAEDEPPMVQFDYQFASEKVNMEVSDEQVVTAGPMVTIFMATFCGRGAVAATQCSKGAIAYGSVPHGPARGLGSCISETGSFTWCSGKRCVQDAAATLQLTGRTTECKTADTPGTKRTGAALRDGDQKLGIDTALSRAHWVQ